MTFHLPYLIMGCKFFFLNSSTKSFKAYDFVFSAFVAIKKVTLIKS